VKPLAMAAQAALVLVLAGCGASSLADGMMGGGMTGGGMMGGGMMGSGMMRDGSLTQPMMVWRQGTGRVGTPEVAAQAALTAVRAQGWDWLTVDEVHIFSTFYEVEFNDRAAYKGPEVYVNRSSGDMGPEMGPNMMWDTEYGMMGTRCATPRAESDARALAAKASPLALGDGERHHGYWEFELKQGGAVVNQINVQDCTGAVVNEQMWQPNMEGTDAPNG